MWRMKECIAVPEGLFHRAIDGKLLYSHVVVASGRRTVYISGQLARNEKGDIIGKGDMRAQLRQVLENLGRALAAVGATYDNVVETTTYTTDIDEYFRCVDVRHDYFKKDLPTSTAIGVSRLSHPDFMVEIKATAVLD